LLRNSFCKIIQIYILYKWLLSFNPRCWGTLFASDKVNTVVIDGVSFQSSLLRNSFCKGAFIQFFQFYIGIFQSSLLRNSFCKEVRVHVSRFCLNSFQSSLLRNSFCKPEKRITWAYQLWQLSILVAEELFLQAPPSVDPEMLGPTSFQSSLLRNSFCKFVKIVKDPEILKRLFQSSLLRNSFCKRYMKVRVTTIQVHFQSSLLRNSFCKI